MIQDDIDCLVVQGECHDGAATQVPLPSMEDAQVVVTHDVNGLAARRLVRDKYANGKYVLRPWYFCADIRWSTLGYLASRFAPGGSLGADNKLFAFAL